MPILPSHEPHYVIPEHVYERKFHNNDPTLPIHPRRLTFVSSTECMCCKNPQGENNSLYISHNNGWLYCKKRECKELAYRSAQPYKDIEKKFLPFKEAKFTVLHHAVGDNTNGWKLTPNCMYGRHFQFAHDGKSKMGNGMIIQLENTTIQKQGCFLVDDVIRWNPHLFGYMNPKKSVDDRYKLGILLVCFGTFLVIHGLLL